MLFILKDTKGGASRETLNQFSTQDLKGDHLWQWKLLYWEPRGIAFAFLTSDVFFITVIMISQNTIHSRSSTRARGNLEQGRAGLVFLHHKMESSCLSVPVMIYVLQTFSNVVFAPKGTIIGRNRKHVFFPEGVSYNKKKTHTDGKGDTPAAGKQMGSGNTHTGSAGRPGNVGIFPTPTPIRNA